MEGLFYLFVLIAISLAFYFLPTIVALVRHHGNTLAIFVANLLTGWTFVGWVIALVWACTSNQRVSA